MYFSAGMFLNSIYLCLILYKSFELLYLNYSLRNKRLFNFIHEVKKQLKFKIRVLLIPNSVNFYAKNS